jgi:tetratricopeptide (TPR) repeat protein
MFFIFTKYDVAFHHVLKKEDAYFYSVLLGDHLKSQVLSTVLPSVQTRANQASDRLRTRKKLIFAQIHTYIHHSLHLEDTSSSLFPLTPSFLVSNTPMSNPIADAIVDVNDEAVAMLQNGDHDHALASFRCALAACRQSPPRLLNFEDQAGTVDENGRGTNNLICSVALGDCYDLAESQTASPDNLFSFYNHAFVFGRLPDINTRTSQQESQRDAVIPTVLIFNSAMAMSGKALCRDGPMSSVNLRKALELYSMAISLINDDQAGFEDLHAIQLASWKNMGYIYSHLSEDEHAMQCRAYLYQALFTDPDTSLRSTYGYSYSLFYLFVVGSEVRRLEMRR